MTPRQINKAQKNGTRRMLELTRKTGESIIIDHDIKIIVLSNGSGQVRLGIEAPDDIEVWRKGIDVQPQRSKDRQLDG